MRTPEQLLVEIEAFCRSRGVSMTAFGKRAVHDGKFVPRLRSGTNMTLATLKRAEAYLVEQQLALRPTPASRRRSSTRSLVQEASCRG